MKILVVEDEEIKRVSLVDDLSAKGYEAVPAATAEAALEELARDSFNVVVTDLRMPGIDGLELLKRIKAGVRPCPEVILMTAYGSIPLAVEAMRIGAFDFITKPFRNETIFPLLVRVEQKTGTASTAAAEKSGPDLAKARNQIIGDSPSLRRVKKMVELCARTDATILLSGETGTGKDLVAATIHELSHRASCPFIKVSCAVFPQQLIESELYGHEKGSFTGADKLKKGRFDMAKGGTLYLDDVDDIPLEQQIKLLRVIEEKVFERVGGTASIQADVRIIASTKENLLAKIETGTFRTDLYYRLNVLRINLPPLRELPDDLPRLVSHFLKRIAGNREFSLTPEAMALLKSHTWPGNVRELAHTLEHAFLLGNGVITAGLLATELTDIQGTSISGETGFKAAIQQTEQELLQKALENAGGNKSAAARALGMKLSTFRDKVAKHDIS